MAASGLAAAQFMASAAHSDGWDYRVTPYLWLPSLETRLDIGPNPPVEGSKSLFEILDGAFLIAGEARRQNWAILGEFNYLSLRDDFGIAPGDPLAEWRLSGTMAALAGAYSFHQSGNTRLEALAGIRRWDIKASTTVLDTTATITRDWIDPIIGLRVSAPVGETATFQGMANVGGFGVGSERQYEVLAQIEWPVSDTTSVTAGYRHLYLDFYDGAVIDIEMSGPLVALTFNF